MHGRGDDQNPGESARDINHVVKLARLVLAEVESRG
jgi:hypothetical protein